MIIPGTIVHVSDCCGTDRVKYPLDTIQLSRDERGHALAVASDGKRTIVARWRDELMCKDYQDATKGEAKTEIVQNFETLIPIKPFKEGFKSIPKKCVAEVLENLFIPEPEVGKNIPLETREDDGTTRRIAVKPVPETDGKFPEWRRAVPAYTLKPSEPNSNEAMRIRIDAELFSELVKTVWLTAGKANTYIDLIVPANQLKPVEIRSNADGGIKVTGFLFPINSPDTVTPFSGSLPANKPTIKFLESQPSVSNVCTTV